MKKSADTQRNFKLIHQTLCITSIDFQRRCLFSFIEEGKKAILELKIGRKHIIEGFVELRVLPLTSNLNRLKLNCKQCRIMRVCIREEKKEDWYEAGFQLEDSNRPVCPDGKKRNLDYFLACQQNAVSSADPDYGGGELVIRIPKEVLSCAMERKQFRVSIEYSLEHPDSGIQFVTPKGDGTMAQRAAHLFTYTYANSSRLWFPCVDSYAEVCTWSIDITVDKDMVAVSCGELVDQVFTIDERQKTFHYALNIPTSAVNIAVAVGPFEIYVDPIMPEVTNFCLPGLLANLKHSTAFLHDVFEMYEENLSCRYPYTHYKQVFVDQAYSVKAAYASMSIFNTSLLHSSRIIDPTFITRRVLAQALAEQFFGCYICMQDWSDAWLCSGIAGYLYSLYVKKAFGNNEYRYYIMKETESVCQYETDGPGLPPLHSNMIESTANQSSSSSQDSPRSAAGSSIHLHPHLTSVKQREVAWSKSHLVLRMIEIRIGQEPLLQVFNKLLSLANTTAQPKVDSSLWRNLLLSTSGFLKSISTVSGKDINVFIDQWICHSGIAKFHGSFVFNRKRNIVELDIKQDLSKGTVKYVGPLTVCVQELDGSFNHTVQIEDITSRHELPCHSKSRRNKKKKIPLMTGEEVDMNLDAMDSDSPVLWLRIDPEVTWLRQVSFEQPDYMWQYQLRHERDIMAQVQSLVALERFPTAPTRDALMDIITQKECFYRVRQEACMCLAKVASASADSWTGQTAMLNIFKNMFGSKSAPQIIRYNDFSNFISYFVLKTLPIAIASVRNIHSQCPREVVLFLMDLLKYNDNRLNKYSDSYHLAALIEALSATVTPGVAMVSTQSDGKLLVKLKDDTQLVLAEVIRRLNLEKLQPSYRYCVTVSCLKALRNLQVNGQVPADSVAFEFYAGFGHFEDVRCSAIECLADYTKVEVSEKTLNFLMEIVEKDPVPYIRHHTLRVLSDNPPFTRKSDSPLCTQVLVERLWHFMCTVHDWRLRCDAVDLYSALFGRLTPSCVPSQGMGIVIDLKEKKIMNLSPLPPAGSPRGSVSGEESTASRKSHKRKSRAVSPTDFDSQPDTPKSFESACSDNSKLKLKIKLEKEEGGVDSGAEQRMKEVEAAMSEIRKHKKKKKKHKHRDEKGKRKMSTSSSNYDSPLMFDHSMQ